MLRAPTSTVYKLHHTIASSLNPVTLAIRPLHLEFEKDTHIQSEILCLLSNYVIPLSSSETLFLSYLPFSDSTAKHTSIKTPSYGKTAYYM